MQKLIFILSAVFFSYFTVSAQSLEQFVKEGVELYDKGDFTAAIEKYKEALKIDVKSPLANYEIALTYFQLKDYENAIKHADAAIKQNKENVMASYSVKGSALDDSGKPKEAIEVYKKAIKKFPKEYLLYYNLALSSHKIKQEKEAEEALIKAINLKNTHTSSHLLLGYVMNAQGKRVQSILPLYFFLILEPKTSRSKEALYLLNSQLSRGVSKDENKENTINVNILLQGGNDEFGSVEMMLSLLEAGKSIEENKNKTAEELFAENTESLFDMLGELQQKEKHTGLWWDLYVDFLSKISKNKHMEAYCYYISQSSGKEAVTKWLSANQDKLEKFAQWMEK